MDKECRAFLLPHFYKAQGFITANVLCPLKVPVRTYAGKNAEKSYKTIEIIEICLAIIDLKIFVNIQVGLFRNRK